MTYKHSGEIAARQRKTQYENSIAYHSVAGSTLEQLKLAKPYYEIAIEYWIQKGDSEQVKFFTDGLSFVNKRIELCKL